MRESRLPLAILLTLATLGLVPWSVAPAARSSTAECQKACNLVASICQDECGDQQQLCIGDCQEFSGGDLQSECIEACNLVKGACEVTCAAAKEECKAACPRGNHSPADPLP